MTRQGDIDFKQIIPRLGGEREAFEELCCQLAKRTLPEGTPFSRLHGAGGDGGVECFADRPNGSQVGWQAKYVFDIGKLLRQAGRSLDTALKIHPDLARYIVCFPFDLTGPTGRPGKSRLEKFREWKEEKEQTAADNGRELTVKVWPAFKLRELLLEHDSSGGIRAFFFGQSLLTREWFSEHLARVGAAAGPRYTPELNVETDLWKWFSAFGRTDDWTSEYMEKLSKCRKACDELSDAIRKTDSDAISPAWPDELQDQAQNITVDMGVLLEDSEYVLETDTSETHRVHVRQYEDLLDRLASLESRLRRNLDAKYGEGKADSPNFRQYMAEYQASFPTANLDRTREAIEALRLFHDWLSSPACSLAYDRTFILSGDAGTGKTHGVCDAAHRRLSRKLPTCVAFGHQFRGEPDPWTRLRETLGLPATLGKEGILDVLNAAGEASETPLILVIDAINETRPLRYWRDRLLAVSQDIQSRPYLRLCITCRTSFLPHCLPKKQPFQIVEHIGFSGVERIACQEFFQHYGLEPPIQPILQPELSNPLYLRLICETLHSRGLRRLPKGWRGLSLPIRAFLKEKEQQFAVEHETSVGSKIVVGSLIVIAQAIADSGKSALSWSKAQRIIEAAKPQADTLPVLEWLLHADLLIQESPPATDSFYTESFIRPAFERLGDFLIARALMDRCEGMDSVAAQLREELSMLTKDSRALAANTGVLAVLSILVPEKEPGLELPDLVEDESVRNVLVRTTVRSVPSRAPKTFSTKSALLIREALGWEGFSHEAMDAVLSTSWQPSAIDAIWLDRLLKETPLAERDAWWCYYLHDRFEPHGTVRRLIDAVFELPLDQLDSEIAERWSIALLWFTAAADRRVKDRATRAATAVLRAHPAVLSSVLQRLITCDDDHVRERALLSCYGTLIVSRDIDVVGSITELLQEIYRSEPEAFGNALIRDHIRCISDLARQLNALTDCNYPELTMQPITSEWPLELPSEDQVEAWGDLLRFWPNEFLSDFFKYSMSCLRSWEHAISRKDMARWILRRVARDLGYEGSGCYDYDHYMLSTYGGGRSRPTWAERIGKKYLWLGMYHLASRLYDHVERKREEWEREPLIEPLILLEERKIDPTLPSSVVESGDSSEAWWIKASADLGPEKSLTDFEWVARKGDIPSFKDLLLVEEPDGCQWRLLVSYPTWGRQDDEVDWSTPYRQIWVHIESYLVSKEGLIEAYDRLQGRNFFGQWMPNGAERFYKFVGEYPWAIPFNTGPEQRLGGSRYGDRPAATYSPCWNRIAVEWEYDASIPSHRQIVVPAPTLFSPGDLWWNGCDGYHLSDGRTVLCDPSIIAEGPPTLLSEKDDLLERLDKLDLRLIWTLLGEKWILGGPASQQTPRCTFSQTALLTEDGSIQVGRRTFFEDYDKNTSLKRG